MINGFVFVRERDDSHESSHARSGGVTESAALRKQTARTGEEVHRKQAFKRLVEKEYPLHHIASRKAMLNDTILNAVDAIAQSKSLMVETARAADVPFIAVHTSDPPPQSRCQYGLTTKAWTKLWPAVRMLSHKRDVSRRPPRQAARPGRSHPAPMGGSRARVAPSTPEGSPARKHASSTTRVPQQGDSADSPSVLQQSNGMPWSRPHASTAAHFHCQREASPLTAVSRPVPLHNVSSLSPAQPLASERHAASQATTSTWSIQGCDAPRRLAPILPARTPARCQNEVNKQ